MTCIHVVSLPHTLLTRDYDYCAYSAKVRRFIGMLDSVGVEAYVYGPDIRDPALDQAAAEYIPIVDERDRIAWFGAPEWDQAVVFDRWQTSDPCWTITNTRAAAAIKERWRPGDLVGIIGGLCQAQIADDLKAYSPTVVEWGIGYSGVLSGSHKVWESSAWMHHVAGLRHDDNIHYFDAVIPNCFDPADLPYGDGAGDYLLFLGRPTARKGLAIVGDIAKRLDVPVLVAGQSDPSIPGTQYVGLVTGQRKADLLGGARAVLAPTTYLEPFGGVVVEAAMCGTPAITTDWGAFTETVRHGFNGYRCRMLHEFLDAVEAVGSLDRRAIAASARETYGIDRGAVLYGRYLNQLGYLATDGWYTP